MIVLAILTTVVATASPASVDIEIGMPLEAMTRRYPGKLTKLTDDAKWHYRVARYRSFGLISNALVRVDGRPTRVFAIRFELNDQRQCRKLWDRSYAKLGRPVSQDLLGRHTSAEWLVAGGRERIEFYYSWEYGSHWCWVDRVAVRQSGL